MSSVIAFLVVASSALPGFIHCFRFDKVPGNPTNVLVGKNSTNVTLTWIFDLEGVTLAQLRVERYREDRTAETRKTLCVFASNTAVVYSPRYDLNASSISTPAYAILIIKDVMDQSPNKDGSKVDVLMHTYVYEIKIDVLSAVVPTQENNVKLQVFVRVHNFIGPKNVSVNEFEQLNVACSADGKPGPNIKVILSNGMEIVNESTINVNIPAYRNMSGMYNCTAENEVTPPQTKRAWLNVRFPASCAMSPVNVTEENSVTLNISTRGNPSVNDYICTHPNGTRLVGNGVFTFIARRRDTGAYHCSVYNGVGNRGNCTGYVNVQYSPGMPQTFVAQPANACRGGYINLTCSNSTANPAVSKYFFYNGVKLLGEKGSEFFQANKTTLGINVFWCVPFNSIGKGKNISVNVTVHENPSILNPRINDATTTNEATPVVENEELEFTFFYNGTRKLNETWKRHDGKPRRGQKFQQVSTYGLNFSLAHRNDSGVYEMIARDDYGCFTVERFNLSVHYKPESTAMHLIPNKRAFCIGTVIQIKCISKAVPDPEYYFMYHNHEILSKSRFGVFNVTLTTEGNNTYTCVSNNTVGFGKNKSLHIVVKEPPKIDGCDNKTMINGVTEGEKVTMMCNISGTEPLNVTWTNGNQVWKNRSLIFEPVNRKNDGTYDVTVSNGNECSEARRSNIQLKVFYKPESTTMHLIPNKRVICIGTVIQIKCISKAVPDPEYYFIYHNHEILNKSRFGVFNVTLNTEGNNTYTCVSNNTVGFGKNKSLHIVVKEPPKIDGCDNKTMINGVTEGEKVTMMCNISGTEPLNVTWTNGNQVWKNRSLIFEPVNRKNDGTYDVTVSNGNECSEARRSNIQLKVFYKPESTAIHVIPNKRAFCKGTLIQIKCISKAVPDPEYYFIYHNHEILSKSRFGVFNVTLNTEGNNTYTCVSNNTVGFGKNKSLHIVVKETPKIDGCDNKTMINGVTEGEKVTMMCNISGTEPLNVTWTNGNQVWKNRSLIFEPVNRKNDGTYDVTVSNGNECSEARRSNIQLKVFYKPESTNVIPNKGVFCTGTVIQIKCISKAVPDPEYYFIYHNHEILSKSRFGVFNVTLNTEGNNTYTCVFNNTVGFGENKSSHIVVRAQPQIKNCLISNKNGMSERFRLNEDETANVSCVISGSKRLKTTWTKGAKLLKSTSLDFNSGSEEVSGTNATEVLKTSGLELNSVKKEEAGIYTVTVNDEAKECNGDNKTLNIIVCGKYKLHFKLNRLHNDDLKNKASSEYRKLETSCLKEIKKIYQDDTNFCDIQLHSFVRGSVIVNLIFFFDGASNFQSLINIVNKKGVKIDGSNIERDSVKTGYFVPPTSEPPTSEPPPTVIIVIVVVVVVTIIAIIVLIICCRKKKKDSEKEAALTDRDDCGRIPMNEVGRENDALSYSPSQYAKGGPPHADSMDGSRESKNNNTNETDSSRVVQEPAYAAVDASKKTKKKKPGEVLYADLGGFRKSGDEKKGSRNDLVLELQPKGKDTKMPQKYEETMYADIDWMKAQRSDNHGAAADVRAPSNDIHNKVSDSNTSEEEKLNLAQKFSDETTDPTKKKEQEVADKGNKGTAEPGVNELAQPMTKQDSADSFLTTRERNDTTLTAVSL